MPDVNKLEEWHLQGLIDLRVTEAFYREQDSLGKLKALQLNPIPEPMIMSLETGASNFLNGSCYLSGPASLPLEGVARIMFPDKSTLTANEQNDVMHILAAQAVNTEVFVTDNDKDFIRDGRAELLKQIGLVVMKPSDAVNYLQARYGWT